MEATSKTIGLLAACAHPTTGANTIATAATHPVAAKNLFLKQGRMFPHTRTASQRFKEPDSRLDDKRVDLTQEGRRDLRVKTVPLPQLIFLDTLYSIL
jgi:hypothetical protein